MKAEITPLPLGIDDGDSDAIGIFATEDGGEIAYCSADPSSGEGLRGPTTDRANAEYIVRCANAHPQLVKALEAVLESYKGSGILPPREQIESALALAGKEKA